MVKYTNELWYILYVVILIAVCFGLNFIYKIIVGNSNTKISGVTKSQISSNDTGKGILTLFFFILFLVVRLLLTYYLG